MEIKKSHKVGIAAGLIVIILSFLFTGTAIFPLIFGLGIIIAVSPFVFSTVAEAKISSEKEEMFLEFARNLVESVKMGSSISKSIVNLKEKSYGSLSKHIEKLANQISLGIPLSEAMQIFAKDIGNKKISRAVTLIKQAEKAGGDIGEILEAVSEAVATTDKLKKERKTKISSLMVQSYVIFFVFIIIILVMQFQILPMISGIAGLTSIETDISTVQGLEADEVANAFLYLLLVQGFFSGLIIGKIAEGDVKHGVKHSFILMVVAFLFSVGGNAFFGG